MADPLREPMGDTKSHLENPALDDHSVEKLLAGLPPEHTLPRSENPRLNQTAENIGAALGTTIGKMRSGLSLVQTREREMAHDLSRKLSQQAEGLSAAAVEKAGQLGDIAEEKASMAFNAVQEQWDTLRERAGVRIVELRKRAAILRDEHPLELIGAFAGAAFVLGAALKVWRSNHD